MAADPGIDELLELMARLRDAKTGCPWDLRQDFHSVAPHTLEEACEVIDAIEREDYQHLPEELGDLLFQVVFHAQLGRERGWFDFASILSGLVTKLILRHPHVFPDGTLGSRRVPGVSPLPGEIGKTWEQIKQQERIARGETEPLSGIPLTLSALARATKLQKRAARHGFDWFDWQPIPEKIREELAEVETAIAAGDRDHVREEIGDLLFACVNLARHLDFDAEAALRAANRKFERRFGLMVQELGGDPALLGGLSPDAREALWQRAKERDAHQSSDGS